MPVSALSCPTAVFHGGRDTSLGTTRTKAGGGGGERLACFSFLNSVATDSHFVYDTKELLLPTTCSSRAVSGRLPAMSTWVRSCSFLLIQHLPPAPPSLMASRSLAFQIFLYAASAPGTLYPRLVNWWTLSHISHRCSSSRCSVWLFLLSISARQQYLNGFIPSLLLRPSF